jgi:hypothetical protein
MERRVFIHKGKHWNGYYLFDTHEDQKFAWLEHFHLNDNEEYYDEAEGEEMEYVILARTGNWKAAKRLAENRAGYEYEGYEICPLLDHSSGIS